MSKLTKEILASYLNEYSRLKLCEWWWDNHYTHQFHSLLIASIPDTTPMVYYGSFDKEPTSLPLGKYVYGMPNSSSCFTTNVYSTIPNRKWNDYDNLLVFDLGKLRLDKSTIEIKLTTEDDKDIITIEVYNYRLDYDDRNYLTSTYYIDINWGCVKLLDYILKCITDNLDEVAEKLYDKFLYRQRMDAINAIASDLRSGLGITTTIEDKK
jgi:hypothetical protein